jgi:YidC/Oxa1 family membrane protein insertase
MLHTLWNTIVFNPISQLLGWLVSFLPAHDLGLAVVLLTLIIKVLLFPLTYKSLKSQIEMKKIQPEMDAIKKNFPDDKEAQARETFALYKKHDINPFSGCLPIFIQLPILFGLYYVVIAFISKTSIDISTVFLGITDIKNPSVILALAAGITQFIQMYFSPSMQQAATTTTEGQPNFMQFQMKTMKYVLPVFVTVIALKFSGIIALYWVTSNVVTIFQELIIKRILK